MTLIEQIQSGQLWDFPGGIHPPENKRQSNQHAPVAAGIADEIVIPLKQHIGRAGDLLVKVGDYVEKGQPLTRYTSAFMLPIHASTSGHIKAIEARTIAHPSGLADLCIVIAADGEDKQYPLKPLDAEKYDDPEALITHIRQAGIAGLGGAGFPTAKKLQSGQAKTDILIINAAECEPYITADDVLMQHYAEEIIQGIEILQRMLTPKVVVIGIEDNKPEAIDALNIAAKDKPYVIRVVPTKYPSGGEKQLIKLVTNLEVPAGKLPADIGILVQNVGTVFAIKRAVVDGEALTERLVTLTGNTFSSPQNVWVKIGTPVQYLLDHFSYKADKKLPRLIMGGPMMGFTLPHANVPITKTSNCILAPTAREIPQATQEMACIRCSQCADACPVSLLPQQLLWHAKAEEYDKCETLNLSDCIECGACAYVCPSEIPLVHYYRQAKAEIKTRRQEAIAAERAKQRFEEKKARMEREKAERESRFKQAADKRRTEMTKQNGGEDAIAAAIERVKSAKQTTASGPKPAVAAAIARAKAKQAEAAASGAETPDNSEMAKLREERKQQARAAKESRANSENTNQSTDKAAAVKAAIERAKARKAQAKQTTTTEAPAETNAADDKKAAVRAAVERAKARKAQTEQTTTEETSAETGTADDKKAAVRAAVERAKSRKAQAEQASTTETSAETDAADDKKAAVRAAVERAKARKAQAEQTSTTETSVETDTADDKKAAVRAAVERAKARKAQAEQTTTTETSAETDAADDKKAAVRAAVERAKARKAQAEQTSMTETPAEKNAADDKKAAVRAAVERAKARKAQAEQTSVTETPAETNAADDKKAAVRAAVERAKARKAQAEQTSVTETPAETNAADDKKAAVRAAVERAKARKAQQESK